MVIIVVITQIYKEIFSQKMQVQYNRALCEHEVMKNLTIKMKFGNRMANTE